jgi:hypothetical protein
VDYLQFGFGNSATVQTTVRLVVMRAFWLSERASACDFGFKPRALFFIVSFKEHANAASLIQPALQFLNVEI